MSHPRLQINGAVGTRGEPGRLLTRGFVGKEESLVVPFTKTPLEADSTALLGGKASRKH